jgi:DNA-binding GntR family transcriptional regulator
MGPASRGSTLPGSALGGRYRVYERLEEPTISAQPAPAIRIQGRQALADQVAESVRTLIMSHALEPGVPVNIDQLSRELEVSPTPVREALAKLESEGLVTKSPLKGYRTSEVLGADELRDLFDFRLLIEPPMARRAAENMTPASAARIRDELATCPEAPGDDYEEYRKLSAHDARLHRLILEIAGNPVVTQAYERTNLHLHIFRVSYHRPMGGQAIAEHARLADALIAGDPGAAERAMTEHITRSRERLLSQLATPSVE